MEARFGLAQRVWVMDRGMASRKNVEWLQRTGRRYVLGAPRTEVKRWEKTFADEQGWTSVREGVEVKLCHEATETFVLCRSRERRQKEQAMHQRFATRIEEGLASLDRRLQKARRPLDRGPLERQIGRLLLRNELSRQNFSCAPARFFLRRATPNATWAMRRPSRGGRRG